MRRGVQLADADQQHLALAGLGVEPHERPLRLLVLEDRAPGADFHHQRAAGREVRRGLGEDASREIEPVRAAEMGHDGLGAIFRREGLDLGGSDIRRVGEDQVVTAARDRREQIALEQAHAVGEPILRHVAARDLQCTARQLDRVDLGAGKALGGEDREAARAGAQIEDAAAVLGPNIS